MQSRTRALSCSSRRLALNGKGENSAAGLGCRPRAPGQDPEPSGKNGRQSGKAELAVHVLQQGNTRWKWEWLAVYHLIKDKGDKRGRDSPNFLESGREKRFLLLSHKNK